MDRIHPLAAWSGLPGVRIVKLYGSTVAQDDAVPVQGMPQVFLRPQGDGHAVQSYHAPAMGHRDLHGRNEPQGSIEHEDSPRIGHDAEKRMVSDSACPGVFRKRCRRVLRPRRGR